MIYTYVLNRSERGVESPADPLAEPPGPAGLLDWGAESNVVGGCPVGRAGRPHVQFKLTLCRTQDPGVASVRMQ